MAEQLEMRITPNGPIWVNAQGQRVDPASRPMTDIKNYNEPLGYDYNVYQGAGTWDSKPVEQYVYTLRLQLIQQEQQIQQIYISLQQALLRERGEVGVAAYLRRQEMF